MKIEINRDEYLTLLELVYIAEWVIHGFKTEVPHNEKKYIEIAQKLYTYAGSFGFEDLVGYDENEKRHYISRKFEDTRPCLDFIEDFGEDSFWFELTSRLAERDLIRQVGEDKASSMSIEELFEHEGSLWEKYADEFDANGLDNLTVEG
jgi:hypothetical protein